MNEAQAKQQLKEIVDIITENIEDESCCEGYINNLFEDNLRIVTSNEEKLSQIFGIGRQTSFTVKPPNIFINLNKCISFCVETAFTTDIPDTKIELIKLTLLILVKLLCCMYVKVTDEMAKIVGFLYERQAYENPIDEIHCIEFYKNEIDVTLKDYSEIMNDLVKLKTIEIIDGEIKLIEEVRYCT